MNTVSLIVLFQSNQQSYFGMCRPRNCPELAATKVEWRAGQISGEFSRNPTPQPLNPTTNPQAQPKPVATAAAKAPL